ncbi:MAG: peptidoglycan DD-metalloendopeptidase family protein [Balneolaceae bacterium]
MIKKASLFTFSFLMIAGLLASSLLARQTYEEKRKKILDEQNNTRAEINVLDARIKTYEQRINQSQNKYQELYKQFENINRLISLQDNKLGTLELEQGQIQEEIQITEEEIDLRERELEQLIQNYKDILLYTYKNGRTSNLELVLSSESINQMLVRSYYLQKLEEQKVKQAEQIRFQRADLEVIKDDLQQSHFKNELVLDEIRDEKVKLSSQQTVQRQSVEKIKAESTNLLSDLRRIRQQKENLEQSFSSLIADEDRIREAENERLARLAEARNIADAARRADEVAKYSTPVTTSFVSDETLLAYEQNFAASKGSLSWPVNSTTVSKKFGITRNPLYGTRTEHPGINIVADPGTDVRVVSDGYVFAIQPTTGYGNTVFVKHGSYFTVYGNLSEINVQNSSILKAGTVIGKSGTDSSELGETLFFMVRKNNTNLNPQDWLSK